MLLELVSGIKLHFKFHVYIGKTHHTKILCLLRVYVKRFLYSPLVIYYLRNSHPLKNYWYDYGIV